MEKDKKKEKSLRYRDKLSQEARKRYDEKLEAIEGCDPYEIAPKQWVCDVSLLGYRHWTTRTSLPILSLVSANIP